MNKAFGTIGLMVILAVSLSTAAGEGPGAVPKGPVVVAAVGPATQPANLLFNGDFKLCAKPGGIPDGWEFSGDPKFVKATLSQDAGPDGAAKSVRMECTEFTHGSGWSHAMLCQLDKVHVEQDHAYCVRFWAKARDIKGYNVQIDLQETKGWQHLGLGQWFMPTERWERYEFKFVSPRTCTEKSKFQISFNSTGTLWIADASMVEEPATYGTGPQRPTHLFRSVGDGNLVPNGSFECGAAGWGSQTLNYITWATPMDRLFGEVVQDEAHHGKRCLKITLEPKSQPVVNFDSDEPLRMPVKAPLAGNIGYLELEPGQPYVLSAWLRAGEEGTPASLGVQQFGESISSSKVQVGRDWKRYAFNFKAKQSACFVVVGPNLLDSDRTSATLWIDAVVLEKGQTPRDFTPRTPVEVAVRTARPGNIFFSGEKSQVIVSAANGGKADATVNAELKISDFWDQPAGRKEVKLALPAGGGEEKVVDLDLAKMGFFKVRAFVDGKELPDSLRIAVIAKYQQKDSLFGINHAYGWPALAEAGTNAGIVWARDWSMAWQNVEPQKGGFNFTQTDYQVDRALKLGQPVLGLLPCPSCGWSSTAPPADPAVKDKVRVARAKHAYPPRDIEEFKTYVSKCVEHCRGRVQWWQAFNEPLYTQNSLPRNKGFTPADYMKLAQAFYEAAKAADKDCKVLAGPGGWTTTSGADLEAMLAGGLLKYCDAIDLHIYPGYQPPEYLEADLVRIGQMMDQHGQRKPLWLTEHGYYADDDLAVLPPNRIRFPQELVANERRQAEFSMRFNLILLAHGVSKIFYHMGASEPLNGDQIQGIFFRYGGEPRKIYPAVAAMANLFSPKTRFVKDASPENRHQRALIFQDGNRLILAAWQPFPDGPSADQQGTRMGEGKLLRLNPGDGTSRGASEVDKPCWLRVAGERIQLRDMMGNPLDGNKVSGLNPPEGTTRGEIEVKRAGLSTSPVFAVADGMSEADFEKAVQIGE